MKANSKLRGGTASELTQFKALWLKPSFADSRDYWAEQLASPRTQAELRAEILRKLKINLRFDKQLTTFRKWAEAQEQRELMAEKIEERKQELLADGKTLEEAQEVLLAEASAYSLASRDFKLGVKVSSEISKTTGAKLDARKVAILEQKAAQLDQVKQVVDSKLTPEQQRTALKEILK